MVDGARVYRRWLLRRLGLLAPGLAAAVLVASHLFSSSRLPPWLQVPAMALAVSLALLAAFLGIQAFRGIRLARSGDLRGGRALRAGAGLPRGVAVLSLLVLPALLMLPLLFRPPPPEPTVARRIVPAAPPHAEVSPAPPPEPVLARRTVAAPPPAVVPLVPPPAPIPPAEPRIHPALADLPQALALEEKEFAVAPELPPPQAPDEAPPKPEERQPPSFRSSLQELLAAKDLPALPSALDRPGLPDEGDPSAWPLPEIRFDVTIIPHSEAWHGSIYQASLDLSIGPSDALGFVLMSGLLGDEPHESEPTLAWYRVTAGLTHRFLGGTRRAPVDFSVSAGAALDRMNTSESADPVEPYLRVTPMLGADLAFWEGGGLGLILHGDHSFATRIAAHSASVTDLRAALRLDLSGTLSLSAGYRVLRVRLTDPPQAGGNLEASFSGPVFGVDLRF